MKLNATEGAVLAYMLSHADSERRAWPTVRELSRATGCHERNVRKALKSLAASGRITTRATTRGEMLPDGTSVRASLQLVHTLAPPSKQMLLPGVRACSGQPRAHEPTSPQLDLFQTMKQA